MDDARLNELLAKKRSPIKAGLVDAVMGQPVSEADKVERIEMIDYALLAALGPPLAGTVTLRDGETAAVFRDVVEVVEVWAPYLPPV